MKNIRITLFVALIASLSTAWFAGCNTTRGFGEDVEDTGEAIQGATR